MYTTQSDWIWMVQGKRKQKQRKENQLTLIAGLKCLQSKLCMEMLI